jgi:hypothetical protein
VNCDVCSIGIALPDEYGEASIDGKKPLPGIGMLDFVMQM